MRYRKSIKICKGVKLNLSKSGVSLTTGVKGLSVTTGKNGTYMNAGIPGTGLSTRKKISSAQSSHPTSSTNNSNYVGVCQIHMDENGAITLYQNGIQILEPSIINQIKRSPAFKREKERLDQIRKRSNAEKVESHNHSIEELIHVCSRAETVYSSSDIRSALDSLQPETYIKQQFIRPHPDKAETRKRLEAEAIEKVSSVAFWSVKKRRAQYVSDRLEQQYATEYNKWLSDKSNFDENENAISEKKNKEFREQYDQQCSHLKDILSGHSEFVEQEIDTWLCEIEMPLDFSIQYDYNAGSKCLYVDLDLPEIEDLPDEVAVQLASGNLKMKKKTQTCLREDYAHCVFGFAVYLASHLFNISTAIEKILISGFTQRRDKEGNLSDDYIYSIIFDRSEFEHQELSTKNPIEFCMSFENRCSLSKTNVFKTIVPFTPVQVS